MRGDVEGEEGVTIPSTGQRDSVTMPCGRRKPKAGIQRRMQRVRRTRSVEVRAIRGFRCDGPHLVDSIGSLGDMSALERRFG